MAAINHMITIPKEQEEFLNDNPDISLSKITQNSISECMEMRKISAATLKEAQRKVETWMVIADKLRVFIEKKGLFDEYLKEDVS
jgi:hypothetical protein